jgi:hypothetical protein
VPASVLSPPFFSTVPEIGDLGMLIGSGRCVCPSDSGITVALHPRESVFTVELEGAYSYDFDL